jgi:hypothetical protein
MMFTFGAIFGSTIMARLALLIDRMDFLLNDFGGTQLAGPLGPGFGSYAMFGILVLLIVTVLVLALTKKPNPDAGDEEAP